MNVLFLDDDPNRTKVFQSLVPSAKLTATADECIKALADATEPWLCVFLDHDLGECGQTTGMKVVEWIEKNRPHVECFVSHSLNPHGRLAMSERLMRAGYISLPRAFGWKIADMLVEQVARMVERDKSEAKR